MKNAFILLSLIPTFLSAGQETICRRPIAKIDIKQVKCLAVTVWGEARGEPVKGQIAVAYTLLNRAVKKTICQVALAHKQYSIFNNNPTLREAALNWNILPRQKNIIDKQSWERAMLVARMVTTQYVNDPTNGATHYVSFKSLTHIPKWTKEFIKIVKIENHTFFKSNKPVQIVSL